MSNTYNQEKLAEAEETVGAWILKNSEELEEEMCCGKPMINTGNYLVCHKCENHHNLSS
jgi:hypothetical protein